MGLPGALPSRGKNGDPMKSGEGCLRSIYGRPIYGDENGGGLEKRERRAPDFVPVGEPASAWVRNRQAHRRALGRHAPFSCGLALPAAVPAGKAGLDPRAVGRESESKTTEVLPADGRMTACPRAATQAVDTLSFRRQPVISPSSLIRFLEIVRAHVVTAV